MLCIGYLGRMEVCRLWNSNLLVGCIVMFMKLLFCIKGWDGIGRRVMEDKMFGDLRVFCNFENVVVVLINVLRFVFLNFWDISLVIVKLIIFIYLVGY